MKAYGIIFNNFTISNTWELSAEKYSVLSLDESALPNCTYASFIAPKRDGSTSHKNRYEDKNIKVKIEVRGKNPIELANNVTRLLEKWIGIKSRLFLLKRPNRFYEAEILDEVGQDETKEGTVELDITFKCSPVMYGIYGDLRDYIVNQLEMTVNEMSMIVNNKYWENITAPTLKTIINEGNYKSTPIIEVTGIATLLTIQIADKTFSIANLNGTIFIDSQNMIVYKIVDGKKVSCLQQFKGVFPDIPVGSSHIEIGGRDLNISINLDFKNTYIC